MNHNIIPSTMIPNPEVTWFHLFVSIIIYRYTKSQLCRVFGVDFMYNTTPGLSWITSHGNESSALWLSVNNMSTCSCTKKDKHIM